MCVCEGQLLLILDASLREAGLNSRCGFAPGTKIFACPANECRRVPGDLQTSPSSDDISKLSIDSATNL